MLLCIVWQGIDWLREKKIAKGIGAIAAVLCWPYVVVVFLLLFPQVQEMPIASTVVAFVITSPLPMWTAITDGSWSFLLGGVLLYALRGHRRVQLTAWALVIFLCDFALNFGMACRQEGFCLDADVHRLLRVVRGGGGAADAAVQRPVAARVTSSCSTGSTRPMCICFTVLPACFITC